MNHKQQAYLELGFALEPWQIKIYHAIKTFVTNLRVSKTTNANEMSIVIDDGVVTPYGILSLLRNEGIVVDVDSRTPSKVIVTYRKVSSNAFATLTEAEAAENPSAAPGDPSATPPSEQLPQQVPEKPPVDGDVDTWWGSLSPAKKQDYCNYIKAMEALHAVPTGTPAPAETPPATPPATTPPVDAQPAPAPEAKPEVPPQGNADDSADPVAAMIAKLTKAKDQLAAKNPKDPKIAEIDAKIGQLKAKVKS